jgi:hypothetical protein
MRGALVEIVDRRVPLSEIGRTVGPSPVPRFVENVRRNGVVIPILLREVVSTDGTVEYRIVDGNRRVAAAREIGLQDIPSRVLIDVSVDDAARLVLTANNFRSENEITEYWAIRHLIRTGASRQRVADDGGFDVRYMRLRDRWGTLDRRIFTGYSEGRIPSSIANKIAKMQPDDQRHFGDLFQRKGRILSADIQAHHQRSEARKAQPTAPERKGHHVSGNASGTLPASPLDVHPGVPAVEDFPVTIVSTGPIASTLPPDLLASIRAVAESALGRGYSLPDIANALTVTWHQVAAVTDSKEEARG